MATIVPLADRLVVEVKKETTTASGIVIPDTASKEKPQEGKVIAVGPGRVDESGNRVAMEVKVGDIVLFTKYAPNEVQVGGEDLLVLNESDVLALIQ